MRVTAWSSLAAVAVLALVALGCDGTGSGPTRSITPVTPSVPRETNLPLTLQDANRHHDQLVAWWLCTEAADDRYFQELADTIDTLMDPDLVTVKDSHCPDPPDLSGESYAIVQLHQIWFQDLERWLDCRYNEWSGWLQYRSVSPMPTRWTTTCPYPSFYLLWLDQ